MSFSPRLSLVLGAYRICQGDYFGAYQDGCRVLGVANSALEPRILLSEAFINLRAFPEALNVLSGYEDHPTAKPWFEVAEKCYNEYRTGSYNIPEMLLEAQQSDRLTHGDFVSEDVKIDFGRDGLRGLFASRDIPAGTLIIAEKAIFSVFPDDAVDFETEFEPIKMETDSPMVHKLVAKAVDVMRKRNMGGRITGLYSAMREELYKILGRQDEFSSEMASLRWDFRDQQPDEQHLDTWRVVENVIRLNEYNIEHLYLPPPLQDLRNPNEQNYNASGPQCGHGLFYTTSFLNHSCIPNCSRFFIGDFIFVVTSVYVPATTELTMPYWAGLDSLARRDGKAKEYRFRCTCPLCEHQRLEHQKLKTADLFMDKLEEEGRVEDVRVEAMLKSLKKVFGFEWRKNDGLTCPPLMGALGVRVSGNTSPLNIASYLTSTHEMYNMLMETLSQEGQIVTAGVYSSEFALICSEAQPIVCPTALVEWMIEVWEMFVRGGVRRAIADTWLREAKVLFKSLYLQAWEILVGSLVKRYYGQA